MGKKQYIFVHGLSGWGSYDKTYRRMPYWGMRGGDLLSFLRSRGFDCYAASVSPTGSAWDRACELYAQLTGTVTDYGKCHSELYKHDRFGKDFRGQALIPDFHADTELVLLGHSFGGATIRLFAQLMKEGDEQERQAASSQALSPLFSGQSEKKVLALITLAAPHNGTTAYDLFADPSFDPRAVKSPFWSEAAARLMSRGTAAKQDGRDPKDYAGFDMHIDRADELNRIIRTDPQTYYFSVPCSATVRNDEGNFVPRRKKMAPSHAPKTRFHRDRIRPGIWQIMPVYPGDHMALQGGLLHKHDIRKFYLRLLSVMDGLS